MNDALRVANEKQDLIEAGIASTNLALELDGDRVCDVVPGPWAFWLEPASLTRGRTTDPAAIHATTAASR